MLWRFALFQFVFFERLRGQFICTTILMFLRFLNFIATSSAQLNFRTFFASLSDFSREPPNLFGAQIHASSGVGQWATGDPSAWPHSALRIALFGIGVSTQSAFIYRYHFVSG